MERYGNSLTLYIDGYLHDIHEAEDLMIEAFAYFVAKDRVSATTAFARISYKSARHLALRRLQKNGGSVSSASTIWSRSRRAMYCLKRRYRQTDERNRILWRRMDELAPAYREALYLVYFEGMRHAEAAARHAQNRKTNRRSRLSRQGFPAQDFGKGGHHHMVHLIEFWDYLVQFLACAAGLHRGAIGHSPKTADSPISCWLAFWNLRTGNPVLDAACPASGYNAAGVLRIGTGLDRELYLPADDGNDPAFRAGRAVSDEMVLAGSGDLPAAVRLIYHVRGHLFYRADAWEPWWRPGFQSAVLFFARRRGSRDADKTETRGLRAFHINVLCFTALEYALDEFLLLGERRSAQSVLFGLILMPSGVIFGMPLATRKAVQA